MNVFNRVEIKYLISKTEYFKLISLINNYGFSLDKYKRSTIQTIYYDTSNNLLINKSLEKPIFKEKIRLRNYGETLGDNVYLEIKRKLDGIVYKRRIKTNIDDVKKFFINKFDFNTQIGKELNSFRDIYKDLKPNYLIISEREAYFSLTSDIRFTFDFDIRYRNKNLNFNDFKYGIPILNENEVLMEIKSLNSYPLWLTEFLSKNNIYKTNFSKYGNAYKNEIRKELNYV